MNFSSKTNLQLQFMFLICFVCNIYIFFIQEIKVTLVKAVLESTGENLSIDPERNVFTLIVLPNDNPHGTVQFALDNFILREQDTDTTQYVPVSRR